MEAAERPLFLILLLGGRPQPNVMLAAQLEPAGVGLVVSRDTPEQHIPTLILRELLREATVEDPIRVDPYQIDEVKQRLQDLHNRHPNHRFALGVTGATVPMTIAAYEQGRIWDCPVYYVHTAGGVILDLTHPQQRTALQIAVNVPAYLLTYNLAPLRPKVRNYATSERTRQQVARRLGTLGSVSAQLMSWLRGRQGRGMNTPGLKRRRWSNSLSSQHWELLTFFESQGVITDLRPAQRSSSPESDELVSFIVPAQGEADFLRGGWLEEYLYIVARELLGEGLLDDVRRSLSFQVMGTTREIDLFATRRGLGLLVSCKAVNNPWQRRYLDDLHSLGESLGGQYTVRLFVTDQPEPISDKARSRFDHFRRQAQSLRIRVINGDQLPHLLEILRKELESPTYPPR